MSSSLLWKWARRIPAWRKFVVLFVLAAGGVYLGAETGDSFFRHRQAHAEASRLGPTEGAGGLAAAPGPAAVTSPSQQALPLPGEFQRQSALILGCNELVVYYPEVFTDVVAAAYRNVKIVGMVTGEEQARQGRRLLREHRLPADSVQFVTLPLNSMWVRDYGPVFARRADGSAFVLDGAYSPQGRVREPRPWDEEAASVLGKAMDLPVVPTPLTFDGGNILTNGDGLCVTTTRLAQENADLGYDVQAITRILKEQFGFRSWVSVKPLEGEQTGHADVFITFLAADVAVVAQADPAADPENARILDEAAAALAGVQTSRGPMKVHRIPMPPRQGDYWRTYTNVIFANGTLLMPVFSDVDPAVEQKAMALYATLMPRWKVVGIKSDSLKAACGLLHCFSVNVPEYVSLADFTEAAVTKARTDDVIDTSGLAEPQLVPPADIGD